MTDRAIFTRLKALPPWQEVEARYRLDLIRGWNKLSLSRGQRKRHTSRMTKRQYCTSRNVNYKTFLAWELNFKRKGIDGIIPKYGEHRKGKTRYDQEIDLITNALVGPARTVTELHAEMSSICKAKKIEIPPMHAFRRILKNTDLRDFLVEGRGAKSWIKINRPQGKIEVDLSRPMACIERMEKREKSHPNVPQIQLMRLRLENYIVNRRREELHSLTTEEDNPGLRRMRTPNPGYRSKVSKTPFKCDAGPLIKCPECGRVLLAAIVEKLHVRCKRCRMWVYIEKNGMRPFKGR